MFGRPWHVGMSNVVSKEKKTCGSVTFGGSVIIKAGQELSHSTSCIFIRWVLYTLGTLPAFHWDRLSRSSTVQENTCGAVWYFGKNRLLLISSPPVWIRGTALDPPTVCVCVCVKCDKCGTPLPPSLKKKVFLLCCCTLQHNVSQCINQYHPGADRMGKFRDVSGKTRALKHYQVMIRVKHNKKAVIGSGVLCQ